MKKAFALLIALTMLLSFSAAMAISSDGDSGQITEAYVYPIAPGSGEWGDLASHTEKIIACHIPRDILSRMTTKALVETVLTYPLLIDMFAFDTIEMGYQYVWGYFEGLQELETRSDAISELTNALEACLVYESEDSMVSIYAKALLRVFQPSTNPVLAKPALVVTLYTLGGKPVYADAGLTWADHGTTEAEAAKLQATAMARYSSAQLLEPMNPSYNCHSYAWYSTKPNSYWIYTPYSYVNESVKLPSAAVGSKVFYETANHSAIVTSITNGITVKSKWAHLGVFSHYVGDSPYGDLTNPISYYRY